MAEPVNGRGRRNGFRLPKSIATGHILTLLTMLVGLTVHYMAMTSDIRALRQELNNIKEMQLARMEQDIRDLERDYRDLREKLEQQPD